MRVPPRPSLSVLRLPGAGRRLPGAARHLTAAAVLVLACVAASQAGSPAASASAAARVRAGAAGSVTAKPPACPVPGSSVQPLYRDTSYSFAERAADLVSCMTLAEKVGQLKSNSAPAIPRLGVEQYTYWSEGQHGINAMYGDDDDGGVTGGVHATSFPVNFASTMSWDPGLVYQETTDISDEARGFLDKSLFGTGQNNLGPSASDYGNLTYWAPTVNTDRDPRWGRTDEAFGEDSYLASQMEDAFVDGYQGETMSGKLMTPYLKVAATAKHFALNNEEDDRMSGSSNTTDANIRDYYTKQFESLTQNAHVAGVMTSYNAVNGTPSPADTYTVNELLQRTYGFNGYTTSDCGAVGDVYSTGGHDWAPPGWTTNGTTWTNTATGVQVPAAAGGQAYALRAGTQVNCTGPEPTLANIEAAINAGILSEGVLDNALVHLFTMRMETGEFDPPAKVAYTKITKAQIQSPAHQALAEKVAADDLVLLKNDDVSGTSAPLLPADPATLNNVVIVGNLADTVTLGDYSGDPTLQVNAVQGITAAVKAANPNATVTYDSCGTSTTATAPADCSAATLAAIKTASLVIVFTGTDLNVGTEGHDRTSIEMPGNYNSLISQVTAVGNPRTALVIQSDGPVDIANTQGDFPAILFSGYNGESQGTALAQVLFGQVNPAGHLDFTWYANDSQLPPIDNYGLTPSQTGGLGRTYMYFTGTPTYPFGYGLSYSSFKYSDVTVGPGTTSANGTVHVNFNVTNTGTTAGATVAQLYVAPQFTVSGVELPQEQLAGFRRTNVLQPGQTQHVTLSVSIPSLSEWDESGLKQVVYDGAYQFRVGPDSATAAGEGTVDVRGSITPKVQTVTVQPDQVMFKPGQTLNLTGVNPWIAPDTNSSLEQPHASADDIIEAVDNNQSFIDLAHAHVSYASSDPGVATVSRNGVLTAVGAGVATISVTVNGVTGSTPIVVQQPFTLTAPSVVTAGNAAQASATLSNPGSTPLNDVGLSLSAPANWAVTATTPTTVTQIPPRGSATVTWTVTPPSGVAPGSYALNAIATFTGPSGTNTASATSSAPVPYPSLADAFDNASTSNDTDVTEGNLDGIGDSLSAQALAAAGLSPGAPVTHDGITFTWPDAQPGTPDNVVAEGQTIAVSGSGATLGILGFGTYGTQTGTGTITYTDGSTQPFSLSFADWFSDSPVAGTDTLAELPYINHTAGKDNQKVSIYYEGIPLRAGKTVAYVTLPAISQGVGSNVGAMHIYAMGFGCCTLSASAPATVAPGTAETVSTTLANASVSAATGASISLSGPSGWTVTPSSPDTASSLGGGQNLTTTWSVTPPASAACGTYQLPVTATLTDPGGNVQNYAQAASTGIVCPSFAAAYDNTGITDDSDPSAGNLDGENRSLSAEALAAVGLTPGASVTHDGLTFTWPSAASGTPDNVVAEGQTIDLSGSGATLGFIGFGTYGTCTGTGTITYTDGSTQSFTLSLADWWANSPVGADDTLATMPDINNGSNSDVTRQISLYYAPVTLEAGKTVASVTLPAISQNANAGVPAIHIFAMAIG